VISVLGEPYRVENFDTSEGEGTLYKYRLDDHLISVHFLGGRSFWVDVSGLEWSYDKTALAALGLPVTEPDRVSLQHLYWEDHAGYRKVLVIRGPRVEESALAITVSVWTRDPPPQVAKVQQDSDIRLATTPEGRTVFLESGGLWRYSSSGEEGLDQPLAALILMAKDALTGKNYELSTQYAQRAGTLAEELYGDSHFLLAVSKHGTGDIDGALKSLKICAQTSRSKYWSACASMLERLEKNRFDYHDLPQNGPLKTNTQQSR
jgi:hypothetical protein